MKKINSEPVPGDHHASSLPPSENDFSVGLLIRFGDIEYVTCGDLDGEYSSSSFGYTYNDIESIVAPRVGEVVFFLYFFMEGGVVVEEKERKKGKKNKSKKVLLNRSTFII